MPFFFAELDEGKICRNPYIWWETLVSFEFPFDPSIDFLRFLRFFLRCPFSLGLQPFERSISMSCRAPAGCNWPEVSQCFFFSLSIKETRPKITENTWLTVRGCIPTLKCFRSCLIYFHIVWVFVWRKPTRWAALSLIFLSTIRLATVHGLVLTKPRNKRIMLHWQIQISDSRYFRWTVT